MTTAHAESFINVKKTPAPAILLAPVTAALTTAIIVIPAVLRSIHNAATVVKTAILNGAQPLSQTVQRWGIARPHQPARESPPLPVRLTKQSGIARKRTHHPEMIVWQRADIAAGIAVAVQMKAIVRVIMAKAVIELAEKIGENRIVMICKIVVELLEVLRSSSVATTSATMPAATRSGDVSSRSGYIILLLSLPDLIRQSIKREAECWLWVGSPGQARG